MIKDKSVTASKRQNSNRQHFRSEDKQNKRSANLLRSVAKDEQHRIDDVGLSASVGADDTRKVFVEGTQRLNLPKKFSSKQLVYNRLSFNFG